MKSPQNRQSGQSFIIILILLALGSTLIVSLLNQSYTTLKHNQLLVCKTINDYAADAGIKYAECKIYNDPSTYIDIPLEEVLTVNGRTVDVTAEYQSGGIFAVVSTASGDGCGKTTIRSYITISHGAFSYSVAAKTYLKISNSIIDSEPIAGRGHIYSNGDIEVLGSSSLVNGNAFAVGTVIKGKDLIVGTITEYAEPVQFSSVYADLYKEMAQEGGTYNGTLKVESGTIDLGPLYITGDLEIKPGATVILTGQLYIDGNVKVEQGHIDGIDHILTEGDINMSGGGYGSEEIPVMISIYGNAHLVGPIVDAVVYAPQGNVSITNLTLYGAVGGNECIISNSDIIYAAVLGGRTDLPGTELYPLTYNYD